MRPILLIHNRYRQRSGEDAVFDAESALLEKHGHRVVRLTADNADIPPTMSMLDRAKLARGTIWSHAAAEQVRQAIRDIRPSVVHAHNTLPLFSPSIYSASAAEGVPVVQTLHNYRVVCPAATLFRDGAPCEDCVGRAVPWPGVLHACYQHSRVTSGVVATMLARQHLGDGWRHVSLFIALTEFARRIFIRGGLPADRIRVKPNFVEPDPGRREGERDGFLFVGRLAPEKGIEVLLRAWEAVPREVTLTVAGDGPLRDLVERCATDATNIHFIGQCEPSKIIDLMGTARALIFPSIWYEGQPITILEAFAAGLPVLASRIGGVSELVEEGRNGLLFNPGDAAALADRIRELHANPPLTARMGDEARSTYLVKYTGSRNYQLLMDLYEFAARAPFSTFK